MNAAVSAFVRSALYDGHRVLGIKDGFEGLLTDQVSHDMGMIALALCEFFRC